MKKAIIFLLAILVSCIVGCIIPKKTVEAKTIIIPVYITLYKDTCNLNQQARKY